MITTGRFLSSNLMIDSFYIVRYNVLICLKYEFEDREEIVCDAFAANAFLGISSGGLY